MTGRPRRRDERGSGTVLIAAVVLVLMAVTAGLLVVAGYVAAAHHARAAADLSALSAASARAGGQDACRAAAVAAARNEVRLTRCVERGDSLDFVVSVTVGQQVSAPSPLLPGSVEATAHAGKLGLL